MIKLKDLLKETLTWENRKFGDRLPTLADYKEAHDKKTVIEATGIGGILEIDQAFKKAGFRVLKVKDYDRTQEAWEGWYIVKTPNGEKVTLHMFINKKEDLYIADMKDIKLGHYENINKIANSLKILNKDNDFGAILKKTG